MVFQDPFSSLNPRRKAADLVAQGPIVHGTPPAKGIAEAKELFAQPKTRGRGARAAAPPLRELGEDPETGKPMVIKDGRFGPYVTDGETNASLRKDDDVATITVPRAAELLADRRAAPPAKRSRTTTTRKKAAPKAASTARSASKRS
jgi:DNA topoisomerase-1